MEKWAEVGDPTPKARLAQARAFLALRMMDRAWIRLRELTDAGLGGAEALTLTGRVLLERGWPTRARPALERALIDTPESRQEELRQLLARADRPPPAPPADPSDAEADPAVILAAAEHQLAAGAFLKAEVCLERVKRLRPDHARADDLLWAMKGDYTVGDASLAALADRLGPDLSLLADITEEPEHTESLDRDTSVADGEPAEGPVDVGAAAFPSLFRRADGDESPPERGEPAEEVTLTSPMAALRALHLDAADDEGTGGDTQIVRVIHSESGPALSASRGPMHAPAQPPSGTFDLAAYRREMGMVEAPGAGGSDFEGGLEEEDDSRILLTHREPSPAERERRDNPTLSGLETLEPDTTSEIHRGMAKRVRLHEAQTLLDPAEVHGPAPAQKRSRKHRIDDRTPWWLLATGFLLLMMAGVLLLVLLVRILQQVP